MSIHLLAIDTSTESCSVALLSDNHVLEKFQIAPRQHNQLMLPMIDALLSEAQINRTQLDVIALGCGPGSFTGLRIAASMAQAIALAFDLPVVLISTLRALAQGAYREFSETKILCALDACLNEIYWGSYTLDSDKDMIAFQEEKVCVPDAITIPAGKDWIGVGSGWDKYSEILLQKLSGEGYTWRPNCYPHAQDVATLAWKDYQKGKMVSAENALPVYLRDDIAKKESERK